MREQIGVMYMLNRIGPRTNSRGTPQVSGEVDEEEPEAKIQKERDDIEANQEQYL